MAFHLLFISSAAIGLLTFLLDFKAAYNQLA
jgi:hypothetical protein